MNKKEWIRSFLDLYNKNNLHFLYSQYGRDIVKICHIAYEDGDSPEETVNSISEKEKEIVIYMAKTASSQEMPSNNDMTRETYNIIGMDDVKRNLHSPSLEELAEIFDIDIDEIEKY